MPSDQQAPERPIDDPSIPLGSGYSESKWVAEQILYAAAAAEGASSSFRPVVLRIGQISGGKNGAWNTSDWVPALIKSSIALRCLPQLHGVRLRRYQANAEQTNAYVNRHARGSHWTTPPQL